MIGLLSARAYSTAALPRFSHQGLGNSSELLFLNQALLDNPLAEIDSDICKAMKEFRETFTQTSMKELYFNPQHLIKALEIYIEQFNYWNWKQLDLFWRQVIGYTQRYVPTCYAQAFCQGLYNVKDVGEIYHLD